MIFQLFLDCVDRAAASSSAFVSFREHPVHQTLNSREVDPIADERVWAMKDDGCNRCCHREVWRQNAETKMKVWAFDLSSCMERQPLSMASERAQQAES